MLQQEARRILYDDDDSWNQTAADNPEWLSLFKKAHGITEVAPDFDKRDALEDLGVLGDLGAFEELLASHRWDDAMPELAAREGAMWGPIPEMEYMGNKGELCVGENGQLGIDIGTDGVQDCFRFPQWDHIPDFPEAVGMMEPHPEIVQGDVGAPQVMRWEEIELPLGMDSGT